MNGRVYDPQIGRFMSADPIVQDPTDTQSLNRYSYVSNNPLSYTDPTGYFSLGNLIKTVIAVVVVVVAAIYGQGWVAGALYGSGTAAAVACTTVCGAIAGAIGGAIAGGITGGGDLRSIAVGAVGGTVGGALGTAAKAGQWTLGQRVVAFGTTGGVTSVAQGGNFQSGFLAAGFATLAGPGIDKFAKAAGQGTAQTVAGTAASAVAGGAGSVLGGGKFANGAVTGAFSYALGRVLPSANDNFTEKNGLGKHLADSWRKGKYAAKPLDGTETKLAGSVLWGAGATTAAGTGAEASGGKAFNLGFGDEVSDFGVFYAIGVTTGVNISADVFIGYVKGDLAKLVWRYVQPKLYCRPSQRYDNARPRHS